MYYILGHIIDKTFPKNCHSHKYEFLLKGALVRSDTDNLHMI